MSLTKRDIYLALAKEVPDPSGSGTLVENPYESWSQIRAGLPERAIRVHGPGPGSGTRTVLANELLDGCNTFDVLRALREEDRLEHRTKCRTLREDGGYVDASENDELTIEALAADADALAVLTFGVLEQHADALKALVVGGVEPSYDTIRDDSYPMTRPLYLYVKKAHVERYPRHPGAPR